MIDLIALCMVVKNLPAIKIYNDDVLKLLKNSMQSKEPLSCFLQSLADEFPDISLAVKMSTNSYRTAFEEIQSAFARNIHMTLYGHELYPENCYAMEDPPWVLSYIGTPCWRLPSLAVVGSREPSSESTQWMEKELLSLCSSERPVIVSGGARGVDQKAHALALRNFLPTIIVLPSGLGQIYPSTLESWVESVVSSGGCLVSEYSLNQRMHKHLFHHRNRLIAALGDGTLLVEARRRSGTLITARHAVQLGRPVWVVPGHPLDPHFLGSLDLLSEGAQLVRDAEDLKIFLRAERRDLDFPLVFLDDKSRGSH